MFTKYPARQSRWPRGLRCRSAAARLLRLWVRIPPGAWMFVCFVCCVLSGRGLCNELITRPEESYRLWCVVVCDLETSWMRRPWSTGGCRAKRQKERKKYPAHFFFSFPLSPRPPPFLTHIFSSIFVTKTLLVFASPLYSVGFLDLCFGVIRYRIPSLFFCKFLPIA